MLILFVQMQLGYDQNCIIYKSAKTLALKGKR